VKPHIRDLNHISIIVTILELCVILFLLVFFDSQLGISLLGEVNWIVKRLITRGDLVLRLQGWGLCDLKPDRCVAF
jgi:hypothetical protein